MATYSACRFVSACIFSMAASVPLARGNEPTLDDLRVQLAEQLTSISAIDCTFTLTGSSTDVVTHWTWKQDGEKELVTCEPYFYGPDSPYPVQVWLSFDGEHGYEVSWDTDDPSRILAIRRLSQPSKYLRAHATPDLWLGRSLFNSSETLLTLLAGDQAVVVEVAEIEGHRCAHVDLGLHTRLEKYVDHWQVWLDVEHDMLPRKLHMVRTKLASDGDDNPVVADDAFLVLSFDQVHDAGLGIQRWFPMRMRINGLHGESELAVKSIIFNASIPKEAFIPEPDFGTEIYDDPPPPGQTRQVTIHGGETAVDARRQRLLEQAAAMSQQAIEAEGPPIDARPSERPRLLKWLPWVSLVIALGAVAWIFWSRRG